MTMTEFAYQEKKCGRCGREFIIHDPEDYVFKRHLRGGYQYFCSWSCLRRWEAQRGSKTERRDRIIQALKDGLTVKEICELVKVDMSSVIYWKKKMEEEKNPD